VTAGIPVTGGENPARLSKELDFKVLDKDGNEVGDVSDMVLDFDNAQVAYVVVGAGGFLGIGEKKILVPWNSLKLETEATGGKQNAFILQTDANALKNAPSFDLGNLPSLGQSVANWDAQIRSYWKNPNSAAANSTPAATATVAPTATANANNGNGTAAATPVALKGVILASKVLGSTVTAGGQAGANKSAGASNGTGNGTGQATATTGPAAGVIATATPGTGSVLGTATAIVGTTSGNPLSGTIKDAIMDTKAGKMQFLVVDASFDDGEHWIPIPLKAFQWDPVTNTFILKADTAMLQKAPFFQEDQFPNTTTSGWDTEFNRFWQK
jgi:sporulation protein YlmC with PRC-barrel domain